MIFIAFLIPLISSYQIWQVTDIHYDPNYLPNTDPNQMCRSGNGTSKPLGDYGCDTTDLVLNSIPPFIKSHASGKNGGKILLYNGDILARKIGDYEFSLLEDGLDNVTKFLKQFDEFEIIPMLGNHDALPENYQDETSTDLYEYAAECYKQWLPMDAMKTFRKGGFYTKKIQNTKNMNVHYTSEKYNEDEEAYVIVLNTVLYYTHNALTADGTDPIGQFVWLEETLKMYREQKKNVLIAAHICPGVSERYNWTAQMYDQYDSRFINLLADYEDIIIGMICGHLHLDTFRLLQNEERTKTVIAYLSPSLDGYLHINPSLRVYDIEGKIVKNYINYKIDLNMTEPEWRLTYNFKKEYGYDDCSAQNMIQFAKDMHNDRKLHDLWYKHMRADSNVYSCDDNCWNNNLCAIEHPKNKEHAGCYKF